MATIAIPEYLNIYTAESMVHSTFDDKRVIRYGEMFLLDEDDIERIANSHFYHGIFILGGAGAGTTL